MSEEHGRVGFATLNGTRFSYEIAGTGQPVIFLHAGITDKIMWNEQFASFAATYQAVRYDLRGFGETPLVEGTYAHYQDLHALLDYLHIESAHLVGCSMGGCTILDFALAYPQRVRSLTVVASTPNGYEYHIEDASAQTLLEEHVAAVRAGNIKRAADLETRYWLVGVQRRVDHLPPALIQRVEAMNRVAMANKVAFFNRVSEQELQPPAVERLEEIRVPTLIIVGDLDDRNILAGSHYMTTHIQRARKATISGTAHFPNMEQPAEFNRLVLAFLRAQV
ncbi:hydrolase [Ktedonobacter sp. SOSP1-52]|uniref:alpha/beta fold hydrolase n=1 Tax=Ktedonobacter sp. SOSP1-52 TaxID=2778366 RepID=UPI001915EB95|nr:alpha/beta fold hydrolase [Ktedonobacter sp. SOSP1-52]GHO62536.1 hydrolase [Ktedonobacter sp. SOSP1-52]